MIRSRRTAPAWGLAAALLTSSAAGATELPQGDLCSMINSMLAAAPSGFESMKRAPVTVEDADAKDWYADVSPPAGVQDRLEYCLIRALNDDGGASVHCEVKDIDVATLDSQVKACVPDWSRDDLSGSGPTVAPRFISFIDPRERLEVMVEGYDDGGVMLGVAMLPAD